VQKLLSGGEYQQTRKDVCVVLQDIEASKKGKSLITLNGSKNIVFRLNSRFVLYQKCSASLALRLARSRPNRTSKLLSEFIQVFRIINTSKKGRIDYFA